MSLKVYRVTASNGIDTSTLSVITDCPRNAAETVAPTVAGGGQVRCKVRREGFSALVADHVVALPEAVSA